MDRVLVISETLHQAEEFHRVLALSCSKDINFRYPESLGHGEQDIQALFSDCCQVIREENINAILSLTPRHVLLHAALLKEFPLLKGPSFEAVFLCIHRYYNKELICNGFNPVYATVDMEEMSNVTNGSLSAVFAEESAPSWVRDTYRLEGWLDRKVKGYSQFQKDLSIIKNQLKTKLEGLRQLLTDNLDREKYPNAFEPSCTVEQYISYGKHSFSFHYVEGCIADQKVVPWAISDIFYLRQKPKRVQYICAPSRVNESTQYQIWGVYREVAQRLLSYGFDNQFLHCEVLVTKDDVVKVIDIVPTVMKELTTLYRQVYQSGDNLKAQMEVGLGVIPRTPRPLPQRAAMLGKVYVTKAGVRLGEVVDIKRAKETPDVYLASSDSEHVIEPINDDGILIMNVITFDKSMDNCLKKSREVTSDLLKCSHEKNNESKAQTSSYSA